MDQAEKERVARNEAAYRELNAALEGGRAATMPLLCECGHEECTGPLFATPTEYEAVRAYPRRFLVLPGHEIPEAEWIVEERPQFTIIEKREDTAEIVEGR